MPHNHDEISYHAHDTYSHNHHTYEHSNSHAHAHSSNKTVMRNSLIAIFVFMLVEAVGGYITHSLALLSDAGHMLSDAVALALSLIAFRLGERESSCTHTYGLKRFEIIAAMINGATLVALAIFIIVEAYHRFANPSQIASVQMLIISVIGLLVNVGVAYYMLKNSDTYDNVNMRGAYLHVLGDTLGSLAAIFAALAIMIFGWREADPIASAIVALIIVKSGLGLLGETFAILMESTPKDIDTSEIAEHIMEIDGALGVHDLHIWTISSGFVALSAHVVVDGELRVSGAEKIIACINEELGEHGIHHATIQVESASHGHSDELICKGR